MHCSNCGEKLVKDAKFCEKCGRPIEGGLAQPPVKKVEKWKKSIKNAGSSSTAVGWIGIVGIPLLSAVLSVTLESDAVEIFLSLVPLLVLTLPYSFFLIVFGKRLKRTDDIDVDKNIKILLWAAIVWAILIILIGGVPGVILILLIIEYVIALKAVKKLKNLSEYKLQLKSYSNKITGKHWAFLGATAIFLFALW